MDVETTIAFAILLLGSMGGWAMLPRFWRGEMNDVGEHGYAAFSVLGNGFRSGIRRSYLIALTICTLLSLFGIAEIVSQRTGGGLHGALEVVSTGLGIAAVVCIVPFVAVILFNRPQSLVPPHLRAERGILSFGARSSRKRT
ncbi:MAG TPA: hypothetical protein VK453_21965 [Micromonosporaceae bacterium]|nr:hypothetical protein [Micromonosporaceae bacterium]HZG44551.1 hypothetical protein [Longimicrobium sp.]